MTWKSGQYAADLSVTAAAKLEAWYDLSVATEREIVAILVGHYSEDCSSATVTNAICPKLGGSAECISAECSDELKAIWSISAGSVYYLGTWHSHPRYGASPSVRDLETSQDTAADPAAHCPQHLMLISGHDRIYAGVSTASETIELGWVL
jgi:proteasome lid subunit RPN8/RPN11